MAAMAARGLVVLIAVGVVSVVGPPVSAQTRLRTPLRRVPIAGQAATADPTPVTTVAVPTGAPPGTDPTGTTQPAPVAEPTTVAPTTAPPTTKAPTTLAPTTTRPPTTVRRVRPTLPPFSMAVPPSIGIPGPAAVPSSTADANSSNWISSTRSLALAVSAVVMALGLHAALVIRRRRPRPSAPEVAQDRVPPPPVGYPPVSNATESFSSWILSAQAVGSQPTAGPTDVGTDPARPPAAGAAAVALLFPPRPPGRVRSDSAAATELARQRRRARSPVSRAELEASPGAGRGLGAALRKTPGLSAPGSDRRAGARQVRTGSEAVADDIDLRPGRLATRSRAAPRRPSGRGPDVKPDRP
jgi:hypothetical protein